MSESFHFETVEMLTVGTLGPKGERVFYLQCLAAGELVSLKFEKQQAAALAEYLDRVLRQLPEADAGEPPSDLDMREPVVEAWTIGALGIAYDDGRDLVILVAEEQVEDPDTAGASARFTLSRAQVSALVSRARAVVAAGRPPCPYCLRPLDPSNADWCRATTDGYAAAGSAGPMTTGTGTPDAGHQSPIRDRPPIATDRALALLAEGDVELRGRMPYSSNVTFLVDVAHDGLDAQAIYKPVRGERPLWDFPSGLSHREAGAFLIDRALGWDLVPPTVVRDDLPFDEGSLQLFMPARFEEHYFTLVAEERFRPELQRVCALDIVINNTDRKSGHCLLGTDGTIWAHRQRPVVSLPVQAADRDLGLRRGGAARPGASGPGGS